MQVITLNVKNTANGFEVLNDDVVVASATKTFAGDYKVIVADQHIGYAASILTASKQVVRRLSDLYSALGFYADYADE